MVTYEDLLNLVQKAQGNFALGEADLIEFVKAGAVRAYKAGDSTRTNEDVVVDFNPETKELRLSIKKTVVEEVKNASKECSEAEGKSTLGESVSFPITDPDTYFAINAAIQGMQRIVDSNWKKENSDFIKTRYQEYKDQCTEVKILSVNQNPIVVALAGVDALLPIDEQLTSEKFNEGDLVTVFVKELKESTTGSDIIVSRTHPTLVSHAMRIQIPEVDLDVIEIKSIARIPGIRARVSVFSTQLDAVERCQKKAEQVSAELGGETIEFVEWYSDKKAYIVSSLKVEARDVHLIESEKQALVEVFKESADKSIDASGGTIKLAQELTGYKIELKIVSKDTSSELPGI